MKKVFIVLTVFAATVFAATVFVSAGEDKSCPPTPTCPHQLPAVVIKKCSIE